MYYIYIIECTDISLYTGVAKDISHRLLEHKKKIGAKYTRSHGFSKLKALWVCDNRSDAQKLEYRIKALKRQQKLALISDNSLFSSLISELDPSMYKRI